jgi:DNA-binding NtrC family response regulator
MKTEYDKDLMMVLSQMEEGVCWQEVLFTLIYVVMLRHDGNRFRTARDLGISLRTLRSKMKQMTGAGYHVPASGFKPGRPFKRP